MADVYGDYQSWLEKQKSFDPYSMNKGQKIGLALSALASGFTRSQQPVQNYLSSTDILQQQKVQQQQLQEQNFRAQIDALNMQKQAQRADAEFQAWLKDQERKQKSMEFQMNFADTLAQQYHKREMEKVKQNQAKVKSQFDIFKQYINTFGEKTGIGKVTPQPIKDYGSQLMSGLSQQQQNLVEEKAMPEIQAGEKTLRGAGATGEPANLELAMAASGMEFPKTPSQQKAEEREQAKYNLDISNALLENRERWLRVSGMEQNEEASGLFYDVLDGKVDVKALPRPIQSRIRGMLEKYYADLQSGALDVASKKANIAQSYASAGLSNVSAEAKKLDMVKTLQEIQNIGQAPPLTFTDIKKMPVNVRDQYYYDPIRRQAKEDDMDGIITTLKGLKDEGMSIQDMAKFLMSMSSEMTTKTYGDFASEYSKRKGMPAITIMPQEIEKYIQNMGYKVTPQGDYVFSAPFMLSIKDPDNLQQLLSDVYNETETPISNEQYTGDMWKPLR